jgi:hypothetical protein
MLATFDTVFEPVFPMRAVIGAAKPKTNPAKAILRTTAPVVISLPCVLARRIQVVSTAGPVINGIPIGTAPRLDTSTSLSRFSPVSRSLSEIASSRRPPAIIKSATVIPRKRRRIGPPRINRIATVEAVRTD